MRDQQSARFDRRTFLGGAATLVGGLASGSVNAQAGGEVVVANWGGDWNDRTVKFIEAPLLESKGIKILRDLDSDVDRRTKLIAEMKLPRGRLDVAHMADSMAADLQSLGVWQDIDYSQIPNAKFIQDNLRSPFFLPWQYSGWVLLYNPSKMPKPTSFADLFDPKYAGKVGINNQHYVHNMEAAGIVAGGSMHDFDKIKKQCLDWKKAVQPKIYPTHQQLEAAFKDEEIWIAGNYKARGLQYAADKVSVATAYPKEGAITVIFGASIPKKAPHKEMAYAYLNALIDAQGMANLVQASFYTPSVTNAALPADFKALSGFNEEEQKKLLFQDFGYLAKNATTTWLEFWNKEFRS